MDSECLRCAVQADDTAVFGDDYLPEACVAELFGCIFKHISVNARVVNECGGSVGRREIARKSHVFKEENIVDRAKENLETIGRIYGYE